MFRPEDNLESPYARAALHELYTRVWRGQVAFSSLGDFEDATGLRLTTDEGSLRDELPPISTFLNRVLALPIALQNQFFELFEDLLATRVEAAIASGTYDLGLETLTAESLTVTNRAMLYKHERTARRRRCLPSGAKTRTSRLASTKFWRSRKRPARLSSSTPSPAAPPLPRPHPA